MSPVEPEPPFDAAIVLGAMLRPDGEAAPALKRRVIAAVSLALAGRAAHLLMTGGTVGHPRPEAAVMRELALAHGLDGTRVLTEERARNTIDNARLSRPIIAAQGWARLALVTDFWHLPRALYVFRRLGLRVTGVPVQAEGTGWALACLREAAALPWTMLRVEMRRKD